jgi:hypothetical protein
MTPCCLVVDTDVLEEVVVSLLISVVKMEAESSEKRQYLPTDRFALCHKPEVSLDVI